MFKPVNRRAETVLRLADLTEIARQFPTSALALELNYVIGAGRITGSDPASKADSRPGLIIYGGATNIDPIVVLMRDSGIPLRPVLGGRGGQEACRQHE